MYELLKAKRRISFDGEKAKHICLKDEYVLCISKEGDKVKVYMNGEVFEKPNSSFEHVSTCEEFAQRFSHPKLQQFVKLRDHAIKAGFEFKEGTHGTLITKRDEGKKVEKLNSSFTEPLETNTIPTIYWMGRGNLKEIPASAVFDREGIVAVQSNEYQAIFVDFLVKMDEEFEKGIVELLTSFTPLSEDDKQTIEYKKLANDWNKTLKGKQKTLENDYESYKKKVTKYQTEIIQYTANVRVALKELNMVKEMLDSDGTEVIKKLKEVESLPFVTGTDYKDTTLIVKFKDFNTTFKYHKKEFVVPYKNVRVELTPTKVTILHDNPIDVNGKVFYHPHIEGVGEERNTQFCCFGDHNDKIANLLAGRKFREVIFTAKVLLGSHNKDDTLLDLPTFLLQGGYAKEVGGELVPVDTKETVQVTLTEGDVM